MLALKDPTVWHWWFFLFHISEFTEEEKENWQEFKEALDAAVEHAGGWKKSKVKRIENLDGYKLIPSQFVNIGWHEFNGFSHSLQARSLLDSIYVQSGWAWETTTDSDAFLSLKEAEWSGVETELEEAVCLMAEVPRLTSQSEAEKIIVQMLSCWHQMEIEEEINSIALSCGFYASPRNIKNVVWVMLVWDEDSARKEAKYLINRLAPPFQLAWLKGRFIRHIYDSKYAPEANKQEIALITTLVPVPEKRRFKTIEENFFKICSAQDNLEEVLGECEALLLTLKINKENLEKLLTDPVYGSGQASMDLRLVAPLRQSIEQIETDFKYKTIAQNKAERVLKRYEMTTQILSEKLTRHVTYLLSLFAVFGAIQAFQNEVHFIPRNILLALVGLIPLAAYLAWLYRKH